MLNDRESLTEDPFVFYILKNNLIEGEGTYHKMHPFKELRNGLRF